MTVEQFNEDRYRALSAPLRVANEARLRYDFRFSMDAIKSKLSALRKEFGDVQPVVAVLKVNEVGISIPSNAIRGTLEAVGVSLKSVAVNTGDNDSCVYDAITQLNRDSSIHGILVELPYDFSGDHQSLLDSILPAKDVAGLSRDSVNGFLRRRIDASQHCFAAATLELIKKLKPSAIQGNICIVGLKNPSVLSQVLIEHNSVVTVCQSCDERLSSIVSNADVIISISLAYEKIKQWMKPNSILLSCSFASTEEQDLNTENHIVVSNHTFYAEVAKVIARNLLQNIKNLYDPEWSLKSIPLKFGPPGQSDLEIARAQQLKHIADLAKEMNLFPHEIELYGYTKCKVSLSVLDRITPTPLGEGKSTTAVGLCQALAVQMKRNTIVCLRQPSQGPTFGIKEYLGLIYLFCRITPTPLGEGKSTTAVGLCQALAVQMKRNTVVCLRQPSQGPTFGIKVQLNVLFNLRRASESPREGYTDFSYVIS
ncbi:C-1-tetrahydrofolate synthase, cytoplasmic [Parasteatoda tepidariorum]|uniref:C-1-tetrahydrofolate synthase, cytoplasmic n=1 Tax=Parasteatoda tepidariorum TaxID=114398 RepID=UPI0039BCB4C8